MMGGWRSRVGGLLLAGSAAIAWAGCGSQREQPAAIDSGPETTDASYEAGAVGQDATTDAGPDAAMAAEAGGDALEEAYPGPFAPPPQVVDAGGPVLASPKLVPVFFAGDDVTFTAPLADFVSKIGATPYFATAVGEYGVGPATALAPVQLTETAPATIDDTAIQTWLQGKLDGNDPGWPANDANTVYLLHYPANTTVTLQGSTSCAAFGGYHNDTQLDAAHGSAYVAYAVIPRCASFGSLMGIDAVTGAESHEIVESVTDPYPADDPAYVEVDPAHFEWERVLGGGEVGDMCAQFPGAFTKFAGFDYTVQRIWSNAQAKAGHDPCQPEPPGEVYFNASPVETDDVAVSYDGQTLTAKGVQIAVGQSKTIAVELFSDGPTSGPWTVSAQNATSSPALGFSFDKTTGVNGDTLMLTITVNTVPTRRYESFLLESSLNGQENFWIGIVGNPVVDDGGVAEGGVGDDGGD